MSQSEVCGDIVVLTVAMCEDISWLIVAARFRRMQGAQYKDVVLPV